MRPPPTPPPPPTPTRSPSASSRARGSPTISRAAPLQRAARRRRGAARRFSTSPCTHADGRRWILVGLGARDAFDPERARVAAAAVHGRARELGTARAVLGAAPPRRRRASPAALVEGTLLAAYRSTATARAPTTTPRGVAGARRLAPTTTSPGRSRAAAIGAEAANAARDLQNTPANDLTPRRWPSARAQLRGRRRSRSTGRDGMGERAWARSPRWRRAPTRSRALIVLRYDGGGAPGRCSGSSARR